MSDKDKKPSPDEVLRRMLNMPPKPNTDKKKDKKEEKQK